MSADKPTVAKLPDMRLDGAVNDALRLGNPSRLMAAVDAQVQALLHEAPTAEQTAMVLAKGLINLRRQEVATLGAHEAFVRHCADGSLKQVVRPVTLSLADGDLFQVPVTRPFKVGTDEVVFNTDAFPKDKIEWRSAPLDPTTATVTFQGYQRLNSVAGCQTFHPPTIMVDDVPRTNPFIERAEGNRGRPGDIVRIVLSVVVLGPVPATGNIIAVNYTLDYVPHRDLLAMLSNLIAKQARKSGQPFIELIDEDEWETLRASRRGWRFTALYDGVGYAYDLRHPEIAKVYQKFGELLMNAVKKALTVVTRNCMKRHPALGAWQKVSVHNGIARVPVVGWAGDRQTMERLTRMAAEIASGASLSDLMAAGIVQKVEDVHERFDPEAAEAAPSAMIDEEDGIADPMVSERNALISGIDTAILQLDPGELAGIGWSADMAASANMADLRRVLSRAQAILDPEL